MKKDFVSLEETISYLQFIKSDTNPFDGREFIPSNDKKTERI